MITYKNINVSAIFDSGYFQHFSISTKTKKLGNSNLQEAYNLEDKDYIILETLIANTVSSYLEKARKK